MTNYSDSTVVHCVRSAVPAARGARSACAPVLSHMRSVSLPPMTLAGLGSVSAAGYRKHPQTRFAMAGINTNVWPLSPKDWLSG